MPSRLLARLDAQIAQAQGAVAAACLRLRKATYLARQGRAEEASAIVAAIREAFGKAPNAEVTAWVSLVESLVHFYSNPGPLAMDRLHRAEALSRAIEHPELVPLCAAWLAHMEFNANQMPQMVAHAAQALLLAQPAHHATLARVSLVVADALHFAGRFDLAKPWYAAVRDHALAEGDDAMISAMLHNVATLHANQVRLTSVFGGVEAEDAKKALLEAESTRNFDIGIGAQSLATLIPLVRAQLLTVQGQYADAIALFDKTLDVKNTDNLQRREVCFFADRAWCNFSLSNVDKALADVASAVAAADKSCDSDDLAAAFARTSSVLAAVGQKREGLKHRRLADQHRAAHFELQVSLLALLNPLIHQYAPGAVAPY